MKTLFEDLQEQIDRVRNEILPIYDQHPSGAPAAMMMRASLYNALMAISDRDISAMSLACDDLKGYSL